MAGNEIPSFENQEFHLTFVELKSSQDKLDALFDASKNVMFELKASFEIIGKHENETEVMRQKYFDMLVEPKGYKETDRDAYFHKEQVERDNKDMFIAASQGVFQKCSRYLSASENVSKQRASAMKVVLQRADKVLSECHVAKQQKEQYSRRCAELENKVQVCESTIHRLETDLQSVTEDRNKFEESYNTCYEQRIETEKQREELDAKHNGLLEANAISKEENERLNSEITARKTELADLEDKLEDAEEQLSALNEDIEQAITYQEQLSLQLDEQQQTSKRLTSEKNDISERFRKSRAKAREYAELNESLQGQNQTFQRTAQDLRTERDSVQTMLEKTRKESQENKDQCVTALRKRDFLRREQNRLLLQQYHNKKRNEIMLGDHRFLTQALDELKLNYRKAEDRSKKDVKLKQDLKDTIKRLRREIEEEKMRKQTATRDVRIQTDASLACESNDIAIQHAEFKMMQALRARDQLVKTARVGKGRKKSVFIPMTARAAS